METKLCKQCQARPEFKDGCCKKCWRVSNVVFEETPAPVVPAPVVPNQTVSRDPEIKFNNLDVEQIKLKLIEMECEYQHQLEVAQETIDILRAEVSRLTNLLDEYKSEREDNLEAQDLVEELKQKEQQLAGELKKKSVAKKVKRMATMSKGKSPNAK